MITDESREENMSDDKYDCDDLETEQDEDDEDDTDALLSTSFSLLSLSFVSIAVR